MKIYLVILMSFMLFACGNNSDNQNNAAADSAVADKMADENAKAAAEYQKKVSSKVADSMANSFVRDWGISEKQARCVVDNINTGDLMRAESDPDVQAQLNECGVDPAVVK